MNRYLITGGCGFIGTNLINFIRSTQTSAEIVVIALEEPFYRVEGCRYIVCDVSDVGKYERYIDGNTIVVHLAWSGFPNIRIATALEGIDHNIIGSCRLFETAVNHNCQSIVFLSSGGAVYGKTLAVPITEQHPNVPLSYYGVEKLAVENYLRLMTSGSSTKSVILRPSNPYGRYQRPFAGQGVIATFLASALLGKSVDVWGDGSAIRDYLYIDDLSDAILKASASRDASVIANIGSGTGSSINEIIELIGNVTGKKLTVNYLEQTSAETGANIMDCTVAAETFGWAGRCSLEDGIRRMLLTWNEQTERFDRKAEKN